MKNMTVLSRVLIVSTCLLVPVQMPGGFLNIAVAQAAPSARVNSKSLLKGMHKSLATIVVAYQVSSTKHTRADGLMLDAARETANELASLRTAIAAKNSSQTSTSVRKVSQAIGRLQGTYRMTSNRNPTVAEGMRALSANWAAFTARYALVPTSNPSRPATQAQLDELKQRVSTLERRLGERRSQAASNPVVLRETEYVYVELERISQRTITIETYQSTLLSLSFISGSLTGYAAVSAVYYPGYHADWVREVEAASFYEGYWDGYYQGYYDGLSDAYFDTPFTASETLELTIDQSVNQQVDVYVTQDITVLAEQADAFASTYSELPGRADDIASEEAAIPIDNPVATAERMVDEIPEATIEREAPQPAPEADQPDIEPEPDLPSRDPDTERDGISPPEDRSSEAPAQPVPDGSRDRELPAFINDDERPEPPLNPAAVDEEPSSQHEVERERPPEPSDGAATDERQDEDPAPDEPRMPRR